MATISMEIGGRSKKRVYFLVRAGSTKKRIPTTIFLTSSEISRNGKRITNERKARAAELIRRKLDDALIDLAPQLFGQEEDASYIAKRLVDNTEVLDFFKFADDWVEHSTLKGVRNYKTFLNSLENYVGQRVLPFRDITFSFLTGYERSLRNKERSVSLYLGAFRHLFREAMRTHNDDDCKRIKNNPFERYNVPRQVYKKGVRALTLEQLKRIWEYHSTGRANLARDCFIMSFCLMGMNSADMYTCKEYKDGRLKYFREKTKDRRSDNAYIEVDVHQLVAPLMKKYKGVSRVFWFYKHYATAANLNIAINVGLKKVGEEIGIPNLQFYQARHTFATLSRNLMGFSKSDVDEALNHVGDLSIADIYIKKDFSVINKNNFALLDRIANEFGVDLDSKS